LKKALPDFSYLFGIQPWQVADLTYGEIDEYLAWREKFVKAQKKGGGHGAR
jgi:hypothetical protein